MYTAVGMSFNVPKTNKNKLLIYVNKEVGNALSVAAPLNKRQQKGLGTMMTTRLIDKLKESSNKQGGKKAGIASMALSKRKNTKYQFSDSTKGKGESGRSVDITYRYKLDMADYGYAIGSENGMSYLPSKESAVTWLKQKVARGKEFYVMESDGSTRTLDPSVKWDYERVAMAMRKGVSQPTIVLPNWYILNDEKSTNIIRGVLKSLSHQKETDIIKEINKK